MSAIDEVHALIEKRIVEIDVEQQSLHGALKELSGGEPRRGPGRPAGSRTVAQARTAKPPKRRRSRKGGTRTEHALSFIEKHPGSTASQVAQALKINPNYVYRLLGDLSKDGKVKKDGKKYSPGS